MKLSRNNEKGSALIVETIVLAIVLATAGYAVYQYETHKRAVSLANSPIAHVVTKNSPSPTTSTTTEPYSGWKSYKSSYGISFKYPSNWTLTTATAPGYFSLKSPVDTKSNLQYQMFLGPVLDRSEVLNDTVVSDTSLGVSIVKPLSMLTMDFNNSAGKDIDGLYVTDTTSKPGSSLNPTFIGFMTKNSATAVAFEAVLQLPSYQNNGGETLSTYQSNPYYQSVVSIFKSLH